MLNTDKVRGIMRANQGSQYPYDILNGGMQGDGTRNYLYSLISDPTLENPYLVGSPIPIPGKPDDLYKIDHLPLHLINFPSIDFEPTLPELPKYSSMTLLSLDTALGKDTTKYKYSSLTNSDLLLQKTLNKKPSLLSQGLLFLKNNQTAQSVVGLGLDYLGNLFGKGVTNNKGSQAVFGMADLAANGLFMANPVLGLGAKAAVTLAKGANKWFGKLSDSYHVDKLLQSQMGGSYVDSFKFMNEAESDLNKFYGFLSTGSRQNANNRGRLAFAIGEKIRNIRDTNMDRQAMSGNDLNYLRWKTQTEGGWDFANTPLFTKQGGTLNTKIELLKSRKFNQVINVDTKLIEEFKEGGKLTNTDWEPVIELFEEWEPEIILEVEEFKDGGKTKEELETPEIEETNQKNLIPEGALHKNKHHMEHTEGLTLKGIPVIDNDGEQLAEIELDEIIFTLEVTKKLEELYKEGTDEAAIEAGKLLVKEILFNTDDRTGLISKCEKGGKI